jgi:NADH-quinone oxidoreductase subunit J
VIALEMAVVLLGGFRLGEAPAPDADALRLGNSKLLGIEIYTHYLYPLQIAAVLLLVAIVAAIALTLRRRKDSKYVDPAAQVRVRKAERLRLVKMQPEVAPSPASPEAADAARLPGAPT